jgi:SOS-response transcriptional repressor LexA
MRGGAEPAASAVAKSIVNPDRSAYPHVLLPATASAALSPRAFGLRVFGDSMTHPEGVGSVRDGCVVVVDPDRGIAQW